MSIDVTRVSQESANAYESQYSASRKINNNSMMEMGSPTREKEKSASRTIDHSMKASKGVSKLGSALQTGANTGLQSSIRLSPTGNRS